MYLDFFDIYFYRKYKNI